MPVRCGRHVPDPLPSPPSVLLYFHGNDATVTVDAQHPGGRLPGWNRTANPAMHAFTPDGPFTPGLKYDIGGAVQSTPPHPLVLIPEVGIPGHWAKTSGGTLVSDPAALSRLIDDAWAHLATLNRPSGVPYLAGGPQCPSLRRMFLAAHSGGGVALGPAAMSSVATSVPTDLWLMDCTYNFGVEEKYVEFCRLWKQRGKLGRDAQSSRMVIIAGVQSVKTTNGANSIVQRLRAGWQDADGQAHAGLSAVRYTHGQFCPISGSCPPGGDHARGGYRHRRGHGRRDVGSDRRLLASIRGRLCAHVRRARRDPVAILSALAEHSGAALATARVFARGWTSIASEAWQRLLAARNAAGHPRRRRPVGYRCACPATISSFDFRRRRCGRSGSIGRT